MTGASVVFACTVFSVEELFTGKAIDASTEIGALFNGTVCVSAFDGLLDTAASFEALASAAGTGTGTL